MRARACLGQSTSELGAIPMFVSAKAHAKTNQSDLFVSAHSRWSGLTVSSKQTSASASNVQTSARIHTATPMTSTKPQSLLRLLERCRINHPPFFFSRFVTWNLAAVGFHRDPRYTFCYNVRSATYYVCAQSERVYIHTPLAVASLPPFGCLLDFDSRTHIRATPFHVYLPIAHQTRV